MKEQTSRRALIMASPSLRRAALAQILHNSRRLAGRSLSGTLSNRPASGGSRFFRGLYLSPERVPEPPPFWPSAAFAALSALRRAFSSMRTASRLLRPRARGRRSREAVRMEENARLNALRAAKAADGQNGGGSGTRSGDKYRPRKKREPPDAGLLLNVPESDRPASRRLLCSICASAARLNDGDAMIKALLLVCSFIAAPEVRLCDQRNATQVINVPEEFDNPVMCAMHGQAYLAETSLSPSASEYLRIVCIRTINP